MGMLPARRKGRVWEDAVKLDRIIQKFPFNTTGKREREFETGFATTLAASRETFHAPLMSQILKSTKVDSVYCFGKKHRPDVAIGEDGIAIEMKLVGYDGLDKAIGQAHIYRLGYRFVFVILVVAEKIKHVYESIAKGEEKDLREVLDRLAEQQNIFTYIVPAFNVDRSGLPRCLAHFK